MKHLLAVTGGILALLIVGGPRPGVGQTNSGLQSQQMQETVDAGRFKKTPPYKVGVAAGYLSNSWVVFCLAYIRYEASRHPEIGEIIVTDAAFNPSKKTKN